MDSGVFATLSAPVTAEVIRSGMVALSQGKVCSLFRRHRHSFRKCRFPCRLADLAARCGHAGLVERARIEREWGTDISTQGLRRPHSRAPCARPSPRPIRRNSPGSRLRKPSSQAPGLAPASLSNPLC